ncbi:hypothetical protein HUJ05_003601 [Dendroctonus ponderosae]|nr:hypothetical protein HUJ05_003601 [Dendroctonus ponderosae]
MNRDGEVPTGVVGAGVVLGVLVLISGGTYELPGVEGRVIVRNVLGVGGLDVVVLRGVVGGLIVEVVVALGVVDLVVLSEVDGGLIVEVVVALEVVGLDVLSEGVVDGLEVEVAVVRAVVGLVVLSEGAGVLYRNVILGVLYVYPVGFAVLVGGGVSLEELIVGVDGCFGLGVEILGYVKGILGVGYVYPEGLVLGLRDGVVFAVARVVVRCVGLVSLGEAPLLCEKAVKAVLVGPKMVLVESGVPKRKHQLGCGLEMVTHNHYVTGIHIVGLKQEMTMSLIVVFVFVEQAFSQFQLKAHDMPATTSSNGTLGNAHIKDMGLPNVLSTRVVSQILKYITASLLTVISGFSAIVHLRVPKINIYRDLYLLTAATSGGSDDEEHFIARFILLTLLSGYTRKITIPERV